MHQPWMTALLLQFLSQNLHGTVCGGSDGHAQPVEQALLDEQRQIRWPVLPAERHHLV